MIKIKQKPEDFVVKERLDIDKFINNFNDKNKNSTNNGDFSYYKLTKTNYNTISAIKAIARAWGLDEKFVNFAGTKDRNAVTEQYISIKRGPKKDLYINDITLNFLGVGKERINLGVLDGNDFEIVVEFSSGSSNGDKLPYRKIKKMVNYFDDQRFGNKKENHIIGKLLVQKKFKDVCDLLKLEVKGNDHVKAIRVMHKKLLQLFVHAYQSYLWNNAVSEYIKSNYSFYEIDYSLGKLAVPNVINDLNGFDVPLVGFGTEEYFEENKDNQSLMKLLKIIEKILEKEKINYRDFIIREIPELSSEGTIRAMTTNVSKLKINELGKKNFFIRIISYVTGLFTKNDDQSTSKKYKLCFGLGSGSYATMAVKTIFN
jgi:tRNA pseudouridine13 synthase